MGTKFAPTYATLVFGFLEKQLCERIPDSLREDYMTKWKRFLDDCFIVLDTDIYDINELTKILNSLHDNITFTIETGETKLSFLDVLILNDRDEIKTDIFHKATDSRQYLKFESCHPHHTNRNVTYALARMIRTIVSDKSLPSKNARTKRKFKRKKLSRHFNRTRH